MAGDGSAYAGGWTEVSARVDEGAANPRLREWPNPYKHCVRTIGVILRKAPRETFLPTQSHGADRRISFGNGWGSSRQTRRSRQDGAPIRQILRSAHRH